MDCYIYYKSKLEHADKIIEAVAQLSELMAVHLHHPMRLQRRPFAVDQLDTWMEIYTDIPDQFAEILESKLVLCSIQRWIVGERRMEHFLPQKYD